MVVQLYVKKTAKDYGYDKEQTFGISAFTSRSFQNNAVEILFIYFSVDI